MQLACFAQFWGVETVGKLWTIEAIVLLFGFISWWGIRKIAAHYPHPKLNRCYSRDATRKITTDSTYNQQRRRKIS
jgi:hypothetical protein